MNVFEKRGEPSQAELDQWIDEFRAKVAAIELEPWGSTDRLNLVELLLARYYSSDSDDDLAEALHHCRLTIELERLEYPDCLTAHWVGSIVHAEAWLRHERLADLDHAIGLLEFLSAAAPHADALTRLAELRVRRYNAAPADSSDWPDPDARMASIAKAVAEAELALTFDPPPPLLWEAETVLGLAVAETVIRDFLVLDLVGPAQAAALSRALSLLTSNLEHISRTSRLRYPVVKTVGDLHYYRWHAKQLCPPGVSPDSQADLAIEYLVELADDGGVEVTRQVIWALMVRIGDRPDRADRDDVLRRLQQLADHLGPDGIEPEYREFMAEVYLGKAQDNDDREALHKAITMLEELVAESGGKVDGAVTTTLLEAYAQSDSTTLQQLDLVERLLVALLDDESDDTYDPVTWGDMVALVRSERAVRTMRPTDLSAAATLLRNQMNLPCERGSSIWMMLAALGTVIALSHDHLAPAPTWSPLRVARGVSTADLVRVTEWLRARLDRVQDSDRPLCLAIIGLFESEFVVPPDGPPAERVATLRSAVAALGAADGVLGRNGPLHLLVSRELGRHCVQLGYVVREPTLQQRGLRVLDEAMAATPPGHPMRSLTLALFGLAMVVGQSTGRIGHDLARGAAALTEAAADTGLDVELRASCFDGLATMAALAQVAVGGKDLTEAVDWMRHAVDVLPVGHLERATYRRKAAELMIGRFRSEGDLQDIDTALSLLRDVRDELRARADRSTADELEVDGNIHDAQLLRATAVRDPSGVMHTEPIIEQLHTRVAELECRPDGDVPYDINRLVATKLELVQVLIQRYRLTEDHADQTAALTYANEAATQALPGTALYRFAQQYTAMLRCGMAAEDRDRARFDEAIDMFECASRSSEPDEDAGRAVAGFLAGAWLVWARAVGDPLARETGIRYFEQSRRPTASGSRFMPPSESWDLVIAAYWERGRPLDIRRAIELGIESLYEKAIAVVLQGDSDSAVSLVADSASRATELAFRCLALGQCSDAVRAIEAGRGLVLHAARWTANTVTVLREIGQAELAAEWEYRTTAEPALPTWSGSLDTSTSGNLRYRVLRALSSTDPERVLAAPPAPAEIAIALTALALDALVYLVPARNDEPGRGLVVRTDGGIVEVPLPLASDPIQDYVAARQAMEDAGISADEREYLKDNWRVELAGLCGWAWRAVVAVLAPHLRRTAGQRPPRVALVPIGEFSVVPWHAARADTEAGPRYAVEDFVFSYVTSARQLCMLAGRHRRPPAESPVVVADPTGDLTAVADEASFLRQCYPDARFFGMIPFGPATEGIGTADDILGTLPSSADPGASMLHLGCHAVSGTTPSTSYLRLAPDQRTGTATLAVERIILRAHELAAVPPAVAVGGLVVLAACQTNVSRAAHDESLTLASAFVTAGATGVTATLWSVPDRESSLLICRYHAAITNGMRPMDALRAAQIWALTPDRGAPAGFSGALADYVMTPTLSAEAAWAAFTHCGW